MNWSRNKNSSEEKACLDGEIYCMLGSPPSNLNNAIVVRDSQLSLPESKFL